MKKTVYVYSDDNELPNGKKLFFEAIGMSEDAIKAVNESFTEYDLKKAVKEQVYLPQNIGTFLKLLNTTIKPSINEKIIEDLKDWNVDEMEVILE